MTNTTITRCAQQATRPGARPRPGLFAALSAAICPGQAALSDRLHADGDRQAARYGWAITTGTGRFGFGNRTYHDPRFAARRAAMVGQDYLVPGLPGAAVQRAGRAGQQAGARAGVARPAG